MNRDDDPTVFFNPEGKGRKGPKPSAERPGGSASGRPGGSASGRPGGSASGRPGGSASGRPGGSASGRPGGSASGRPRAAIDDAKTVALVPPGTGGRGDDIDDDIVLSPGTRIGHYEIKMELGRGGMGLVYLAEHVGLRKPVAFKTLLPEVSASVASIDLFKQEWISSAELEHPRIVSVKDAGEQDGIFYLALEFMDGGSVQDALSDLGRLPPERVYSVLRDLLEGLSFAHDKGIVHCDLKPANLLQTLDGTVKISDFGLASIIGEEAMVSQIGKSVQMSKMSFAKTVPAGSMRRVSATYGGTWDYMAPEVKDGEKASPSSDLFAVGVIAYYLLTGSRPSGRWKPASVLVKGLNRRWDQWIDRLLDNDPADRWSSAGAALKALNKFAAPNSGRAATVVAACMLLLAATGGAAGYYYREPIREFLREQEGIRSMLVGTGDPETTEASNDADGTGEPDTSSVTAAPDPANTQQTEPISAVEVLRALNDPAAAAETKPALAEDATAQARPEVPADPVLSALHETFPNAEMDAEVLSFGKDQTGLYANLTLPADASMRFRLIPAGSFEMGSPPDEPGRTPLEPELERVEITEAFMMGQFEVTHAQFEAFFDRRSNPSYWLSEGDNANRPIDRMDWETIMGVDGFIPRLNRYLEASDVNGWRASLPTSAQWEYACRAGTKTSFNSGKNIDNLQQASALDAVAHYFQMASNGRPVEVGTLKPNAWGLYDMHGNLGEWCRDGLNGQPVLRGGSWRDRAADMRSASFVPMSRNRRPENTYGFRIILERNRRQ